MKVESLDQQYINLLREIKENGVNKGAARKNMPGTRSVFDRTIIHPQDSGLAILKGKKVAYSSCLTELLWFLKGDTNISYLINNGCNIWNKDAYRWYNSLGGECGYEEFIRLAKKGLSCDEPNISPDYKNYGDCGRIYGAQWRNFGNRGNDIVGTDQIYQLINSLKLKPNERYHIVSAWDAWDRNAGQQALPACHVMFICNIREGYLDLSFFQRSCDMPLGVPFNLLSYSMLQHILANIVGLKVGNLKAHLMDCHYYEDQIDYVDEYISREDKIPYQNSYFLIKLPEYDGGLFFDKLDRSMFAIADYNHLSEIKATLSVGL